MSSYKNDKLIKKITDDLDENKKLILNTFTSKKYSIEDLLKIYTQNKYDINKELKVVEAFLSIIKDNTGKIDGKIFNIIIEDILTKGYFEEDIIKFLDICFIYGLTINYTPYYYYNSNLMHVIFSYTGGNNYKINLLVLYNYLKEKGLEVLNTNPYYTNILYVAKQSKENEELVKVITDDRNKELNLSNEDILLKIKNKHDIDFIDNINENLLFKYASIYYEEEYTLKVIEVLLDYGLDPNLVNKQGLTFIHHAIKKGHNNLYIYKLLKLAIKYNYNINYITEDNDNIVTYLLNNSYTGTYCAIEILSLLLKNGFKTQNESEIINLLYTKSSRIKDLEKCIKLMTNKFNNLYNNEDINYLKQYRKDIVDNYVVLDNYNDLLNKGNLNYNINLIVGEKDIGKSTFLKYYYNTNYDNNVLLINRDDILKKCEVIGQFKTHLLNIIRLCAENNITLLIDDIDEIFLNNMSDLEKNEISIVIRSYIKEYGLKIIGTIREDKKEIITNNKLLNDFIYEINLEQFNKIDLEKIINYIFENNNHYNYFIWYNDTKLGNLFKQLLLILSNKNYINNPDISIISLINSVIDNLINANLESDYVYTNLHHIIDSIKNCNYIKEEIKEIVIKELETKNIEDIESKILKKLP